MITRRGFLKLGLGAALGVVAPLTYDVHCNEDLVVEAVARLKRRAGI